MLYAMIAPGGARKEGGGITSPSRIRDLGWMNGWVSDGEEMALIEHCQELGHDVVECGGSGCVWRVTCRECGYTYRVDSTG